MRTIERPAQFKKDWKREKKGQYRKNLEELALPVFTGLANDATLPARLKDHALTGDWDGYRDCHIRPDLVLIYRKMGNADGTLQLARLGSHAELGL